MALAGLKHTLGVDIGGTKVAAVVCDPNGRVVLRDRESTFVGGHRDPGLAISFDVASRLYEKAKSGGLEIDGVGVGVPEYVTADGVLSSNEVMEWTTQPSELFAPLGRVTVESDVRCGAIAEARVGAGRGLNSFMYVTVGTGLSSTFVINGETWAGQRGEAIAFGEVPVDGLVASDSANLESYSSGAGMAVRYREATGIDPASAVAILADQGDPIAHEITTSSALALGRALSLIACVLDPGAFVLGGGLGTSSGLWWKKLGEVYLACSMSRSNPPRLIRATLGEDSGAVGAAITAFRARGVRPVRGEIQGKQ